MVFIGPSTAKISPPIFLTSLAAVATSRICLNKELIIVSEAITSLTVNPVLLKKSWKSTLGFLKFNPAISWYLSNDALKVA